MICCRRVQSTRLLQCGSLMTSRKTTSFVLTATLAVLVCCWIVQLSLSYPFPCLLPDAAWTVGLPHKPPKNRCKRWHTDDKPQVKSPTNLVLLSHLLHQYKHQQSHEWQHQELAKPIVCYLYCRQMTTIHHIELLASPFFGTHMNKTKYRSIFFVHISL